MNKCKYCRKRLKYYQKKYCTLICYRKDGGHYRAAYKSAQIRMNRVYLVYKVFNEKYGHLDHETQIRIAIAIGMRRAYNRRNYEKRRCRAGKAEER